MAQVSGFAPVSRPDARVLILGSMPSRESLTRGQYYAHPRNAFWPILTELLGIDAESYEERVAQVQRKGFAIWDVLRTCFRSGSLDSAIDDDSAVTNDFAKFYREHRNIRRVFFNGAKAEALYRKRVVPGLTSHVAELPLIRLPSTSPANAGMSLEQKRAAWRILVDR